MHVGIDRQELIVAPVNPETGTIDPLYADIQQSKSLFQPKIKQTFATGRATEIISVPNSAKGGDNKVTALLEDGVKEQTPEAPPAVPAKIQPKTFRAKSLIFGTTTNFGVKLSATARTLPEMTLGYKRKEFAIIPIDKSKPESQKAPSLFGSISVGLDPTQTKAKNDDGTTVGILDDPELELKQIIATGAAAENAASSTKVRKKVEDKFVAAVEASATSKLTYNEGLVLDAENNDCIV